MIFECMFNVDIKVTKTKSIKLNHWDSRIEAAHEKISNYRQKQIDIRITKTVENEFSNALLRVLDEFSGTRDLRPVQKLFLSNKVSSRRLNIISKLKPIDVNYDQRIFKNVEDFYVKLSKTDDRLERIRIEKGRKDILPEDGDRRLLMEAIVLKNSGKDMTILTSDSDFLEFTREIFDTFRIKIESIQ